MSIYKDYVNARTIAVIPLSNHGGLEILESGTNCDDQLLACFNFGNGREYFHFHNVHCTPSGRAFIRKMGVRYYLDQMMRV